MQRARALQAEGDYDHGELSVYLDSIVEALAVGNTVLRIPAGFQDLLPLDERQVPLACVDTPRAVMEAYVALPHTASANERGAVDALLARYGFLPSRYGASLWTTTDFIGDHDALCAELEQLFTPMLDADRIIVGDVMGA
ncbi:MAG: hypothetical protein HYZ29_08600 [Myxococcales bacterium]|nr:hypothetical protein [Myxococcales bacterium]